MLSPVGMHLFAFFVLGQDLLAWAKEEGLKQGLESTTKHSCEEYHKCHAERTWMIASVM